jgi:hypothetical protein
MMDCGNGGRRDTRDGILTGRCSAIPKTISCSLDAVPTSEFAKRTHRILRPHPEHHSVSFPRSTHKRMRRIQHDLMRFEVLTR